MRVDLDQGVIENLTQGTVYRAEPFPPFLRRMMERGGLMASITAD